MAEELGLNQPFLITLGSRLRSSALRLTAWEGVWNSTHTVSTCETMPRSWIVVSGHVDHRDTSMAPYLTFKGPDLLAQLCPSGARHRDL